MAYEWKNLNQQGDQPTPRSGHSLNWVGNQNYLLYGGIEDGKNGKIAPDPDIYIMKLAPGDKCTWYKEQTNSAEKPLARSQHCAQATPKADKLLIFGGHHTQQSRLNDTWILHIKDMEWRRIGGKPAMDNQESEIGAPQPRANMGSCVFKGKVVVFGGHGGISYQRKNFDDLHMFDFETEKWEHIAPINSGPEGRGGCSVFAKAEEDASDKIFVYGGWNSEKQFNEIWMLDLEKMEWTDCDIFNGVPRWNHCSLLLEAIPTWKFFIFGGECAEYNEGAARSFGEYVNSSCYIDLGMM
jgi:dynein heavy chain